MEFIKNDLIDRTLERYYLTFRCTLDTSDFVSEKYTKKIEKYIFKNLKKKFREVNTEYKKILAELKHQEQEETAEPVTRPKAEPSAIECLQGAVEALPDSPANGGDQK
jgi:actin-related protein